MAKKASGGYPLPSKWNIHDKSEAKAERDGLEIGVANGLNLTKFLNELFYNNFENQMTDEELDAAMRAEFPKRTKFQKISAYRSYYNNNLHGHGQGDVLEGEYRLPAFRPVKDVPPPKAKKESKEEKTVKTKAPPRKAKK